jgi:ribose transport system permease protein
VLVFSTITNLFAINNLSTEVQNMVKGGIIVLAVLIQQIQFKSVSQFFAKNNKLTTS